MKMKILIVEDDSMRIEWFREKYEGSELTVAKTVKDAVAVMKKTEFDRIFLDHDLGGETNGMSYGPRDSDREDTGAEVVRAMIDGGLQKNAEIIVHSNNPVGAMEMMLMLSETGYQVQAVPFSLIAAEVSDIMGVMNGN